MDINIQYYVLGIILTYIPFHLFEEAIGNFPKWMFEHRYTPVKKSYGFWMAGNIFFYFPLLIAGALSFHFGGEKFLFAGLAVLIWGILNFLEHLFFTLKDKKVSPGIYSGLLLAVIGVLGINRALADGYNDVLQYVFAVPIAIVFAALPAPLQKYIGNKLWKDFN
ncbi:MAG: HXXEE domain-containing protein [Bacillota bacterium]